ncbi:FecR family protein [Terrihabitans sp. B22-R8]|uniref:FecR family protein n=1 Tax=Terrihabitans sp. B22-R8 TaxID=3425128 RepID=UPI00403C0BBE
MSWVVRIKSGEATRMDAHRLSAWRAQSSAHEEAFREAADLWRKMGAPAAATAEFSGGIGRRGFLTSAAAAGVAGLVFGGSELGFWPGISEWMVDHRTGVGEQRTITLADGIQAELNTRTGLSVEKNAQVTRISLVYGEAAFRFATPSCPLEVRAGTGTVRASTDALFTARVSDGPTQITCLEGEVETVGMPRITLMPGQQTIVAATGFERPAAVNADSVSAWRQGMLVFEDRSLEDVVAELNRYRQGRIFLTASNPRRVNGIFHLARPDEALAHFAHTFGLNLTRLPGGIVLLG